VTVSEATVRRTTEAAGAAYEAVQTAAVEAIERHLPPVPLGPRIQLLSVDGAMVPLQHQEWAEVKTLALGTVQSPARERGEWLVHAAQLSYCSRLTEAESFGHLALVETHRRGTETARTVGAVSDGAEWIQGFVDLYRPDAVRLVDLPHATAYVARAGHAVFGEGTEAFTQWCAMQRQVLKHGNPGDVWRALRQVAATAKRRRAGQAVATGQERVVYLEKRRAMLDYAWLQARGYPIGSGAGESANKLVVAARLKGAGMPWARRHVNPMVARRTIACRARWAEAWPQIAQHERRQAWHRRLQTRAHRRQLRPSAPMSAPRPSIPGTSPPVPPRAAAALRPVVPAASPPVGAQGPKVPSRPPPHHPWRRFPRCRLRPQRPHTLSPAKL
jgi:hypothetical protein